MFAKYHEEKLAFSCNNSILVILNISELLFSS